jgi:hypothetical protein
MLELSEAHNARRRLKRAPPIRTAQYPQLQSLIRQSSRLFLLRDLVYNQVSNPIRSSSSFTSQLLSLPMMWWTRGLLCTLLFLLLLWPAVAGGAGDSHRRCLPGTESRRRWEASHPSDRDKRLCWQTTILTAGCRPC